jgi:hypothetical protein
MSLINTNYNYLETMGTEGDPLVGIIISVYYLGCAIGRQEGCNIFLSGGSQFQIRHYVPRWCQRH